MNVSELKEKVQSLGAEDAIKVITDFIDTHPEDPSLDEALTLRGMKYWGLEKRSAAINDYLAAIRLNPESRAVQALNVANEILDYYNKDLYNP